MELRWNLQWTHDNVFGGYEIPENADEIVSAGNAALEDYAARHGLAVYSGNYDTDDAEQLLEYREVLFNLLCDTGTVLPERAEIMLHGEITE